MSAKQSKSSAQQLLAGVISEFADGTITLKSDPELEITLTLGNRSQGGGGLSTLQTLRIKQRADKSFIVTTTRLEDKQIVCPQHSLPVAMSFLLHKNVTEISASLSLVGAPNLLPDSLLQQDFSYQPKSSQTTQKSKIALGARAAKYVEETFEAFYGLGISMIDAK
jgi:hypothetical protein